MARMKKDKRITNRKLEDHIDGEAKISQPGVGDWDVKQMQVDSDVNLSLDQGYGKAVVIRSFDFKANPEAFHRAIPTKQELFNAHARQIEGFLLQDGLQVMPEVNPQVKLSKDKTGYRIVVGAEPAKGHLLHERPKSLIELANDSRTNSN